MAAKAFRSVTIGKVDQFTRSFHAVVSTRNPVKGVVELPDGATAERLEVLDSWDLQRFALNPIVLLQHDAKQSGIGTASNVSETDAGLEMTITLAGPANARAAQALQDMNDGTLRGLSVGFDFGVETQETRNGVEVSVFRGNELSEVSLVTIPADADALAGDAPPALTPEDAQRRMLSDAARNLARGRQKRADAKDEEVQRFDTYGRLGKVERTAAGGIRVPARIARIGVLKYRKPDGSIRRELRLPEEVFHPDSLAGLKGATVTDLEHHSDFIDPVTWKDATIGHVEEVRSDGDQYVEAVLVINDADAIRHIDAGELADISCGYACKLEAKSGVWNGEPYDFIQRRIRHNHVAVLPPGRGRSGTDVGIRLDATDAESVEDSPTPEKETTMKMIHFDGKDYEYGSEAHIAAIQAKCDTQVAAANTAAKTATDSAEAVKAHFDAEDKKAKKAAVDDKEEQAKAARGLVEKFKRRLRLMRSAFRAFGEDTDDEDGDEGDKKKMDALETELFADTFDERKFMVEAVKRLDADFDDTGKSDAYVEVRFDLAMKEAKRADSVETVIENIEVAKRKDAKDGNGADPEKAARDAMKLRNQQAASKPLGISADAE